MTQTLKKEEEQVFYCTEHKSIDCDCEDKEPIGWLSRAQPEMLI